MYYCYGKGIQKSVLDLEIVPFSENPLSEVPLYHDFYGVKLQNFEVLDLNTQPA